MLGVSTLSYKKTATGGKLRADEKITGTPNYDNTPSIKVKQGD